ncbi:hypothetical protein B591_29749 [Streptomyces sp. GBA 94-10 4N24]|uniref:hypothetical protein n=1 Tax=unclassified Streptomyces TaxID=2593676 RepID=UPI0003C2FC2B|nr:MULTISPECIES: hypothetical protein [unclassified Streptomyces]ESP95899.1 hypothetical protein B591_29749 [Streptomyces sp. GBA 94-10 4N24]UZN62941.1 hypothetical protein B591N_29749 [Streptomyces sp. GBA 94-10 4N24]
MRRVGVYVGAVVAAAALVSGCAGASEDAADGQGAPSASAGSSAPAETKGGEEGVAARDVELGEAGFQDHDVWGPGAYVTPYSITNRGDGAASYFVGLEFLDADGDVLGSTGVTADKLGPGKTSKGDTAPLEAEIQNGELADIRSVRVSTVERTPV